ncbi:hypothetical protein B0H19DRAFT_1071237 [Mycena capillaripes]|nr:hypothetical protein B0H19DRAFT_1071237 [Mycena capillaripes]
MPRKFDICGPGPCVNPENGRVTLTEGHGDVTNFNKESLNQSERAVDSDFMLTKMLYRYLVQDGQDDSGVGWNKTTMREAMKFCEVHDSNDQAVTSKFAERTHHIAHDAPDESLVVVHKGPDPHKLYITCSSLTHGRDSYILSISILNNTSRTPSFFLLSTLPSSTLSGSIALVYGLAVPASYPSPVYHHLVLVLTARMVKCHQDCSIDPGGSMQTAPHSVPQPSATTLMTPLHATLPSRVLRGPCVFPWLVLHYVTYSSLLFSIPDLSRGTVPSSLKTLARSRGLSELGKDERRCGPIPYAAEKLRRSVLNVYNPTVAAAVIKICHKIVYHPN